MITLNRYCAMKRFALPPSLGIPILGVLAFVAACTDATSPDPRASLRPGRPTPVLEGNVPPPPTRTAISVTVSTSDGNFTAALAPAQVCTFAEGAFEGVYFSNGRNIESTVAASQLADPELAFEGTAWLRIDNAQPDVLGTRASANARFQRTDQKLAGRGSLTFINGCTVVIEQVLTFASFPACNAPGEPCALITFRGTMGGQPARGSVVAFNREFCEVLPGGDGPPSFDCPEPGS